MERSARDLSISNDRDVVQRFVDRNIADGLSPTDAFKKACLDLRMICEFNWEALTFDSKSKTVLARTDAPASTSTVKDRTPSKDGNAIQ